MSLDRINTSNAANSSVQSSFEDLHHEVLLNIEAIIFASDAPVSIARLKEIFQAQYSTQQIRQLMQQLALLQHGRAVELIETAQGFRFQVRAKYQQIVSQVWPERPMRLSPSLLETLAVIAYHQPVTRADIEQIRGVSSNSQTLRMLFEWNWIKESGVRDVPGRPALLVTTSHFLNAFGLSTLGQLPPLQDAKEMLLALEAHATTS